MPAGNPVYLAALPGEQLFMLADRLVLPDQKRLGAAANSLADASDQFSFGASLKIKTCMTVGVCRLHRANVDQAYSQAQIALLTALARGERWLFHADWMSQEVERRANLADEFRDAVARKELVLYIQPQFHLRTGRRRGGYRGGHRVRRRGR